jgi:hypothetical protein
VTRIILEIYNKFDICLQRKSNSANCIYEKLIESIMIRYIQKANSMLTFNCEGIIASFRSRLIPIIPNIEGGGLAEDKRMSKNW